MQEVPAEIFNANCIPLTKVTKEFKSAYFGFPSVNSSKSEHYKGSQLNVIVMGIDSLSRLAFERFLPKTMRFLKEQLQASIFNKYSIIGDGTAMGIQVNFFV